MSSDYCQSCDERIVWGRPRTKGEWCNSPTCANYAADLAKRHGGQPPSLRRAFKGIAGGKR